MKFNKKQERWSEPHYIGRKQQFIFDASNSKNGIYVTVRHKTKDIRYNSLWEKIEFKTMDELSDWCDNFDHTKFKCLGKDV